MRQGPYDVPISAGWVELNGRKGSLRSSRFADLRAQTFIAPPPFRHFKGDANEGEKKKYTRNELNDPARSAAPKEPRGYVGCQSRWGLIDSP